MVVLFPPIRLVLVVVEQVGIELAVLFHYLLEHILLLLVREAMDPPVVFFVYKVNVIQSIM